MEQEKGNYPKKQDQPKEQKIEERAI